MMILPVLRLSSTRGAFCSCDSSTPVSRFYSINFEWFSGLPKADSYSLPDPYIKLLYTRFRYVKDPSTGSEVPEMIMKRLGRTAPVMNSENPEWPEVFSFTHEPGTGQRWLIEVEDDDLVIADDLGIADIDVDEFASHRGIYRANLSREGYITIRRTTPFKFNIRANNLPSQDWGSDNPSDPFVRIYSRNHAAHEDSFLHETSMVANNNDPIWQDELEYAGYSPNQNQILVFKIYDRDTFSADDFLGEALVNCDELVTKRDSIVYPLVQTGRMGSTLTIQLL